MNHTNVCLCDFFEVSDDMYDDFWLHLHQNVSPENAPISVTKMAMAYFCSDAQTDSLRSSRAVVSTLYCALIHNHKPRGNGDLTELKVCVWVNMRVLSYLPVCVAALPFLRSLWGPLQLPDLLPCASIGFYRQETPPRVELDPASEKSNECSASLWMCVRLYSWSCWVPPTSLFSVHQNPQKSTFITSNRSNHCQSHLSDWSAVCPGSKMRSLYTIRLLYIPDYANTSHTLVRTHYR